MEKYRNSSLGFEARANDLLGRMSLKEKAGQLNQRMYGWKAYEKAEEGFAVSDAFKEEVTSGDGLGALYGLFRADPWSQVNFRNGIALEERASVANMLQRYVIENTRLGIPLLLSEECPHGHMSLDGTMFPVNLGIGSTWNCELYEEAFSQVAAEIRATGGNLGLVSSLDILHDPRWGRSEECYGEDPFLASAMAAAATRGLQGETTGGVMHEDKVVAVLKHFCAQGAATGGHNGKSAVIGERELREIHLPPMKAAIKAGAMSCMAAYNEIDGSYCHANKRLLTGILRDELGFDGVVMSDGCAVDMLKRLFVSDEATVAAAVAAGVDLNLWSGCYSSLENAVREGLLEEKLLDIAVHRVLMLKFKLGLFDRPYTEEGIAAKTIGNAYSRQLNLKLARESVVLLKNSNNTLPLHKELKKIAVIGPNADSIYNQLGDYTPPQLEGTGSTLLLGIRKAAGENSEVVYAKGCGIRDTSRAGFEEAIKAAENAEVVILALGGSSSRDFNVKFDKNGAAIINENKYEMDCGEGMDVAEIELGGVQAELVGELATLGKPVIAVMIQGRPYSLIDIEDKCNAILCAWYPGKEGGEAIADILFGKACPSGKLPVSIPRGSGQLPVYYNYKETADYLDMPAAPEFPFGFGLSYTSFDYGSIQLSASSITAAELEKNGFVEVFANISNIGAVKGTEVVQLYISGSKSGISRRVKELKGFRKIELEPGAGAAVTFRLGKEELGIWNSSMEFAVVPGKVKITVGPDSTKGQEAIIEII